MGIVFPSEELSGGEPGIVRAMIDQLKILLVEPFSALDAISKTVAGFDERIA